jgi:hypothetical protein
MVASSFKIFNPIPQCAPGYGREQEGLNMSQSKVKILAIYPSNLPLPRHTPSEGMKVFNWGKEGRIYVCEAVNRGTFLSWVQKQKAAPNFL